MTKSIGELLLEMGLIVEEDLDEALAIQREQGEGLIGEILVDLGYVSEDDVLFALGAQADMEVVDLDAISITPDLLERVPANFAETYQVVPVHYENGVLTLAMADAMNVNILDDLRFHLGCEVRGAIANPKAVQAAIDDFYMGREEDEFESILDEINPDDMTLLDEKEKDTYDPEEVNKMANLTPVVKLLNLVLLQAIKDHASDIHLEPFEDSFKVRYRIDGVLYDMRPVPPHLATPMVSRVKVMANLNISETRLPQDGRIELSIGGRSVDLRVSTLPVMFGESVVMRILDRSNVSLDLNKVGLLPRDLETLRLLIEKPNGIILVTGPTGSGKTTTLYSCLREANTPERKIITCEDPVEYDLYGIIQVQINPDQGLTYAGSLRAILRQDPDMVLVGEIRDEETAKIAIEAALTGHVVLSTLHTNDAPSVVTRIVDLDVEPFLVAATLEGVVAQRLVRTICPGCKQEYDPTVDELADIGLRPEQLEGRKLAFGNGCKKCNNSGYKGRTGIYEVMLGSEDIKQQIIEGASTATLRRQAIKEGMKTLRQAGIYAIYQGRTTIEEVMKETMSTV